MKVILGLQEFRLIRYTRMIFYHVTITSKHMTSFILQLFLQLYIRFHLFSIGNNFLDYVAISQL